MEILKEVLLCLFVVLPLSVGGIALLWKMYYEGRKDRELYRETHYAIINFCEMAYARMALESVEEVANETNEAPEA